MKQFKLAASKYSMGITLAALSGTVAASGFALIDQSVSGMGNAYAGGAAVAEDATTIFFNPAGMSRLSGSQFSVSVQAIQPSVKFSDGGSTGAAFQTQGGTGGDAGSLATVPNVFFMTEINKQLKFGLGINAPFASQTNYDPTGIGRFQGINSSLKTVNLNPAFSLQINDSVSVGAGISYQRITGEMSSAVNYSAAAYAAGALGLVGANKEGVSTASGNGDSYGYNLGALFNFGTETRLGMAYRSQVKQSMTGTVSFTNVPAALASNSLFANGNITLDMTMPDSFSTSVVHQLNEKLDVMTDLTWTGWSVFQNLNLVRSNGTTLSSAPEYWKNTWRVSLGTTYRYNENWTSRFGVAYDQSPVPDAYRSVRFPDQDRTWLALGGQYKLGKNSSIDFGYAHLFVQSARISQDKSASGAGIITGTYTNSADIVSLQYSQMF